MLLNTQQSTTEIKKANEMSDLRKAQIKKLEQDLYNTINTSVEKATEKYVMPQETTITTLAAGGWIVASQNVKQIAIDKADQTFKSIAGSQVLFDKQPHLYNSFMNQLRILEEKEIKCQGEQWPIIKQLMPYKSQQKTACIKEIETAIHGYFKQEVNDTFLQLIIQSGAEEIKDQFLLDELKKRLLDAVANDRQKDRYNIPALEGTFINYLEVLDHIEIAKALDKIDSFKEYSLANKINYIDTLNKSLHKIKKCQMDITEKTTLSQNDPTNLNYPKEISELKKNIAQEKEQMQQIITAITLLLPFENAKEQFNIPKDTHVTFTALADITTYFAAIRDKVKDIFQTTAGQYNTVKQVTDLVSFIVSPAITTILKVLNPVTVQAFNFLRQEISDVLTKPKSYFDRLFRGSMILTSGVGMVVGIGFLVALAANPFSGPVVGGILVGAVATVCVAAASAKLASWVSKKVSTYRYGIEDIDFYKKPTAELIKLLGSDKKAAEMLGEYFLKEILSIQKELNELPKNQSNHIKLLQEQIASLKSAWRKLLDGDNSSWEAHLHSISKAKMNACRNKITDTAKITDSLLELTTSKSEKLDDLKSDKLVHYIPKSPISFTTTHPSEAIENLTAAHNKIMQNFKEDMEQLAKVNQIITRK